MRNEVIFSELNRKLRIFGIILLILFNEIQHLVESLAKYYPLYYKEGSCVGVQQSGQLK